jgi:hypothetical protein
MLRSRRREGRESYDMGEGHAGEWRPERPRSLRTMYVARDSNPSESINFSLILS